MDVWMHIYIIYIYIYVRIYVCLYGRSAGTLIFSTSGAAACQLSFLYDLIIICCAILSIDFFIDFFTRRVKASGSVM